MPNARLLWPAFLACAVGDPLGAQPVWPAAGPAAGGSIITFQAPAGCNISHCVFGANASAVAQSDANRSACEAPSAVRAGAAGQLAPDTTLREARLFGSAIRDGDVIKLTRVRRRTQWARPLPVARCPWPAARGPSSSPVPVLMTCAGRRLPRGRHGGAPLAAAISTRNRHLVRAADGARHRGDGL